MPDSEEAVRAWVQRVEEDATTLCASVKAATEAGVPDGLLLPALVAVFREQGMIPDSLSGMLGGMV